MIMATYYHDHVNHSTLGDVRRWHPTLRPLVYKAAKELMPHEVAFEVKAHEDRGRKFNTYQIDADTAEIICLIMSARTSEPKLVMTEDELEFCRIRIGERLMLHECIRQGVMTCEISKDEVRYRVLNTKPPLPANNSQRAFKAPLRRLRSRFVAGD